MQHIVPFLVLIGYRIAFNLGHMTKRRPPTTWTHLCSGDMVNSIMPKHRIDNYIKELELDGYLISTEPTSRGYRLTCLKSPLDRPKQPKLRVVK